MSEVCVELVKGSSSPPPSLSLSLSFLCGNLFAALFCIPLMIDMVFTITSVKLLALYLLFDTNEVFLHGMRS